MTDSSWPFISAQQYSLTDSQQHLLISQKILFSEDVSHWYCDYCTHYHPFEFLNGNLYKTCFGFNATTGPIATDTDTKSLCIDLQNLTEVVSRANRLSIPRSGALLEDCWILGLTPELLVCLTKRDHTDTVAKTIYDIKKNANLKKLHIITLAPLLFTSEQQLNFKAHEILVASLAELLANNWLLPSNLLTPTTRFVIDPHAKDLRIDGVVIKLPERLFITALLIARASPNPLSEYDYSQQYWSQVNSSDSGILSSRCAPPVLTQAVSELNTKIKRHTFDKAFQLKGKKQGYIVNPDFLPLSIV